MVHAMRLPLVARVSCAHLRCLLQLLIVQVLDIYSALAMLLEVSPRVPLFSAVGGFGTTQRRSHFLFSLWPLCVSPSHAVVGFGVLEYVSLVTTVCVLWPSRVPPLPLLSSF